MVGLSDIPNVFGGFAPFPNSIMIPFMGAQSAVLAYNFGIYYELGKRTVKSLDNDFFNKIRSGSAKIITVLDDGQELKMKYNQYISYLTKRNSQQMITDFRNIIPDFQSLQNDIIEQSVTIEEKKAMRTPSAWMEIAGAFLKGTNDIETIKKEDLPFILRFLESVTGIPITKIEELLKLAPGLQQDAPGRRDDIPESTPEPEPEDDGERFDKNEPPPLDSGLPDRTASTMTQTMAETDLGRTSVIIRQRVKYIKYTDKTSGWWSRYLIGLESVMAQLVLWQKGNAEYGRLNNLIASKFSSATYNYRQIFGKNFK